MIDRAYRIVLCCVGCGCMCAYNNDLPYLIFWMLNECCLSLFVIHWKNLTTFFLHTQSTKLARLKFVLSWWARTKTLKIVWKFNVIWAEQQQKHTKSDIVFVHSNQAGAFSLLKSYAIFGVFVLCPRDPHRLLHLHNSNAHKKRMFTIEKISKSDQINGWNWALKSVVKTYYFVSGISHCHLMSWD